MATLNDSHHPHGGVVLYSGELILLFCDLVNCEIEQIGSVKGKIYLTTYRVIFTAEPINKNPSLKSISAPFYAMFDLSLEQPIFGANYIKGKVRTNSSNNSSPLTQNQFIFKLKFMKGGAIEFGQALTTAAKTASSNATQSGYQGNYNFNIPTADQYYQAPSSVYQPNYPIGFVLPTSTFTQQPQVENIYTQQAPPPYPGLVTLAQQNQFNQTPINPYSNSIIQPNPNFSQAPPSYNPNVPAYPTVSLPPENPSYPSYPNYTPQTVQQTQSGQPSYPDYTPNNLNNPNSNNQNTNIPSYEDLVNKKN